MKGCFSMGREDFRNVVLGIEVFDTHTHLSESGMVAKSFWDIVHYFWFLRELKAAGYPKDPGSIPEDERIEAFLKSFAATRNTSMNWVVRQIFKNLYGIEIGDASSIRKADELVRLSSVSQGWAKEVADKMLIRKMMINDDYTGDFRDLPGMIVSLPRFDHLLDKWIEAILKSKDQRKAVEEIESAINNLFEEYRQKGYKGVMTTLPRFNIGTNIYPEISNNAGRSRDEITVFLLHCICRAAEDKNLLVQLFLGMEYGWSNEWVPVNDPERIVKLHGLFEKYNCDFELAVASEINNMDAVQAAVVFPNVYLCGPWYFNFRASSYRDCMQKRLEALPPSKCSFIVSDAWSIEWCYGKILLVKHLLADFLYDQIQLGWIDCEEAVRVAREWLFGTANAHYNKLAK